MGFKIRPAEFYPKTCVTLGKLLDVSESQPSHLLKWR